MGNLILTKSHKAVNPYFAEKLGINLYTGEELSYFIYNYYMLLDEDILEDRLFNFIERELEMKDLASKLRRWRGQASFDELLLVILQDIHYYNSKELTEFSTKLTNISKNGTESVLKEKADYLVNMEHSFEAIRLYDRLLSGKSDRVLPEEMLASIYLNKGIALARIYDDAQAAACFIESLRVRYTDEAMQKLFMLHQLNVDVDIPDELLAKCDPDLIYKWKGDFESAKNAAKFHGKSLEINAAGELDDIRRPQRMQRLLEEWKAEYIRCQG